MSRKSILAASATLVLVLAAGPAPAFAADEGPVRLGPVVTAPGGGGDMQPAFWSTLCKILRACN